MKKMFDLSEWFGAFHTQHEQKYRRLILLKTLTDGGTSPEAELINLYKIGRNKQRLQELEILLRN